MKIAFIGGTGFIGRATAKEALNRGHEVMVIHRGNHPCTLEGVQDVILDRKNTQELEKVIDNFAPDVVIETFAMTKEDAEHTLKALKGKNASVIILSSQDVYAQFGSLHGHPADVLEDKVTEESPLTVPHPYKNFPKESGGTNYDKKEVEKVFEKAVTDSLLNSVSILRLPATYGEGDPQKRFASVVERLKAGNTEFPHSGGATWKWTHGHIQDVAHAILLAAESRIKGYSVFNVGEEKTLTMRNWVEAIAEEMGKKISWKETENLPDEFFFLGNLPNDVVVDTTKIRKTLGFAEKLTFKERLSNLVHFLQEN